MPIKKEDIKPGTIISWWKESKGCYNYSYIISVSETGFKEVAVSQYEKGCPESEDYNSEFEWDWLEEKNFKEGYIKRKIPKELFAYLDPVEIVKLRKSGKI